MTRRTSGTGLARLARPVLAALIVALSAGLAQAQTKVAQTQPLGMTSIDTDPNTMVMLDHATSSFDDSSFDITMPFDFVFFGVTKVGGTDILKVGANGYATFGTDGTDFTNDAIPSTNDPSDFLAPFWDDLRSQAGAKVQFLVDTSTPGAGTLTIEWTNLEVRLNGGSVTMQLILHETSNDIEFKYDVANVYNGATATIGLEDSAGMVGVGGPNMMSDNTMAANNFRFVDPTNPELSGSVTAASLVQTKVAPGAMFSLSRTITNGGPAASNVLVRYYASTDATIETTDTEIGSETIASLAGTDTGMATVTLPMGLAAGSYTLGLIVDPLDTIMESNESDNAAALGGTLEVGPDARYTRSTFTSTYASIVNDPNVVEIFGPTAGGGDDSVSGSQAFPANFSFSFFGQSVTEYYVDTNGYLAFGPPAGSLFTNAPLTSTTGPNQFIPVLWDDLQVTGSGMDSIVSTVQTVQGSTDRVLIIEFNALPTSTFVTGMGSFSAQIHLFENSNIIEIHYPQMGQDFQGRSITAGIRLEGATIEAYGTTSLSDDIATPPTTNFRYEPIIPAMPDLEVTSAGTLVTHANQTKTYELSRTVANSGATFAGMVEVAVYMSTDATVDTSDMLIDSAMIAIPAAGQSDSATITVTIPGSTQPGSFFLGVIVDPTDAVTEVNETNNTTVIGNQLTVGNAGYERSTAAATYTSIANDPNVVEIFGATAGGGDDSTRDVTLPMNFNFSYFGNPVTNIRACTNGWVALENTSLTTFTNAPLTGTSGPDALIAAVWADLRVTGTGTDAILSTVQTVSGGTDRVLIIEFKELPTSTFVTGGGSYSAQVHLFENTNKIEIHYAQSGQDFGPTQVTAGIRNGASSPVEAYGTTSLSDDIGTPPTMDFVYELPTFAGIELVATAGAVSPTLAMPGSTAQASVSLNNQGTMDAGAFRVGIYLSDDMTIDTSDQLIGSVDVASLTAGSSTTLTTVVTIPAATVNGAYFIGAIADDQMAISEPIEGNNTSPASAFTVGNMQDLPDLTATTFTTTNTTFQLGGGSGGTPPGQESVSIDVMNTGTLDSGTFDVDFIISTDMVFDASDIRVGGSTGNTITAGGTITETITINFFDTDDIFPGTYFLTALIDADGDVAESDETNNAATPIMITVVANQTEPDYLPAGITVSPTIAAPGSTITVTANVMNIGGVDGPGSYDIDVYASTDLDITTSDDLLFSMTSTNVITAGGMVTETLTGTIPMTQTEGPFFVGLALTNVTADANTFNNDNGDPDDNPFFPVPLTIAGTAQISEVMPLGSPTVSRSAVLPGELITLNTNPVANLGTSAVSNLEVGIYLFQFQFGANRDYLEDIDRATATRVGSYTIPSIGAGMTAPSQAMMVAIPANTTPGSYSLGVFVDDNDMITEVRESDNGEMKIPQVFSVGVQPLGTDLVVPQLTLGMGPFRPGDSVDVTRTISNLRANPALPFMAGVFLSTDSTIDTGDTRLDTLDFANGLLGSDGPTTFQVTIPMGTADGNYFIGILADEGAAVMESDETNNTASAMVQVQSGPPCDVTADGNLDVTDVQQVINVALGLPGVTPTGRENVNGDADVNVVDVQLVINGALGGSCP